MNVNIVTMFLGTAFYTHIASLHPGGVFTSELNAEGLSDGLAFHPGESRILLVACFM